MKTLMSRQEIVRLHPLEEVLPLHGVMLVKRGAELVGRCPFHADRSPSLRVNVAKQLWYCDPCDKGGSVIDFLALKTNRSVPDVLREFSEHAENSPLCVVNGPVARPDAPKGSGQREVCRYAYTNENREVLFEVVRYEPKTFRQVHLENGKEIWNMDGVERVLFNLPHVIKAKEVWIVEGEKDAANLLELGFVATCNVGGAGKWLDSYSETLRGKDVVICGDNDKPGQEHAQKVAKSLIGKAAKIRTVKVPVAFKDISDLLCSKEEPESMREAVVELLNTAEEFNACANLPLFSMTQMREEYIRETKEDESDMIDIGRWLPAMRQSVRPLRRGELVTILADTGMGKTAVLQNIALAMQGVPTLLFELELPATMTFERFMQIAHSMTGPEVEKAFRSGQELNSTAVAHIHVCPQSRICVEEMEKIIVMSELKIGRKPKLVMVDYVGLLSGKGDSRYERVSTLAENLKILAKKTNTVVIMASQVKRKEGEEVSIHDAKDSGSVENSSGLVLGLWREAGDKSQMNIKVLKNTKGTSGFICPCKFDGPTLKIWQSNPLID